MTHQVWLRIRVSLIRPCAMGYNRLIEALLKFAAHLRRLPDMKPKPLQPRSQERVLS